MIAFTKSILIIDDEPDIREIIRNYLTTQFPEEKFMICEAGNGFESQKYIQMQKFNLIITDLRMPKKDGTSVIKDLFKVQSTFKPEDILIVSSFFPDNFPENNSIFFLDKPFEESAFVEKINDIFEKRKLKKEKELGFKYSKNKV